MERSAKQVYRLTGRGAMHEVRDRRQHQGGGADHADILDGKVPYSNERRALHIPQRRQDDRAACIVAGLDLG